MADKKVTRELAIFINDRQVTNSLAGVTREISKVNGEMRNLNKNSATYDEDLKKLQKDLAILKDRQSEFKDEIASTSEISAEASENISKIFLGLSSGNLNMAKEGLLAVRASLSGLVASAVAFVATPVGATIAALAGIVYVTKQWVDYNESIKENQKLIENLTGKTGQIVNDIRNTISGLAATFDVEFKSIANAVDNLMDTGVAKNELEALDKIKMGLLKAPDKNEFLASLEDSALVAKQLGIDLDQVIALKESIENQGVDAEKVFGALQKATKSLSEQSDSLRQKLSGALGEAFTDDLLKKVRTGEITVNQALISIAEKAKESGLNIKQQAELTTALFGKAGVAAGGLETVTKTLTEAQAKQTAGLTPLQQATKELADSQIELQKAQDDLLASEGYEIWKNNTLKAFNTVKIGFYQLVNQIISGRKEIDRQITENSQNAAIEQTKKDAIDQFEKYIASLSKSIGKGFNFDSATGSYLKSLNESLARAKKERDDFEVKSLTAEIEAVKQYAEERSQKQKEITAGEIKEETVKQENLNKIREDAAKKKADQEEKRRKEQIEKEQALSDAKVRFAKAETDFFLMSNKSRIESGQRLTDELVQQEIDRINKVKSKKEAELNVEKEFQLKKAFENKKSDEEYILLKKAIDLEYENKRAELVSQTDDQIKAVRNAKAEQDRQIALEQLAAQKEIDIANAENEWEEKRLRLQKEVADEDAILKDKLQKEFITKDQYNSLFKQLDDRAKEERIKIARAERDAKLSAYGDFFGNIAQLLGENTAMGKAAAIAQIGISQGLAIARVWEGPSLLPQPLATINRVVQSGIAVANVLQALKKVNSVKVPTATSVNMISKSGFFYGGDTGSTPALGYDQFGAVTGVVHEDEWVAPKWMKQSPRYARTINWLENERKRVMRNGFATGGNVSSSGTSSTIPSGAASDNMDEMLGVLRDLKIVLQSGIFAKVFFGYEDAQAINDLLDEKNQSQSNGTLNQ